MQVSVYQNETLIGTASLEHLDPPMGIAFGPFSPSEDYDRVRHANVIDGKHVGDNGESLTACDEGRTPLKGCSVAIADAEGLDGERELTAWFESSEDFAAVFATHDDFKAYCGR